MIESVWLKKEDLQYLRRRFPDLDFRGDKTSMGEADGAYVMNLLHSLPPDRRAEVREEIEAAFG